MVCYFILRRMSMIGMHRQVRREGRMPWMREDSRPRSPKRGREDGRRELDDPVPRPASPGQPPNHPAPRPASRSVRRPVRLPARPADYIPEGYAEGRTGAQPGMPVLPPDHPAPRPAPPVYSPERHVCVIQPMACIPTYPLDYK